ncbi:MBL fold metallo-hydrolase [bacterium AH-315-J21]|nr:MBL fold metallo-hydrolase [bacterium AH-315-J21]
MTYEFGQFQITPIVEHRFYLDGGTMFGVVPRKIWGRLLPVDDNNFIPMSCTLYVVVADGKRYLIDTGLGDCLTPMEEKIYSASNDSAIDSELARLNLTADDIDVVLLTHLHTDHAGGAVVADGDSFIPKFPKATYYVQRREFEDALNPDERSVAAYSHDRVQALSDSGCLVLLDGDTEIASGVTAVVTGGHTAAHQGFEFVSGGQKVVNYCDVVPTAQHVKLPYGASVDLYPLQTVAFKKTHILPLIDSDVVVALAHDHQHDLVRFKSDGRKIIAEPVTSHAEPVGKKG